MLTPKHAESRSKFRRRAGSMSSDTLTVRPTNVLKSSVSNMCCLTSSFGCRTKKPISTSKLQKLSYCFASSWQSIIYLRQPLITSQILLGKCFLTRKKVMPALLCLPHSNADSERFFSMVRKIHTEARSSLGSDTLTSFLQVKLNSDSCCYDFEVTSGMRDKAKCCTDQYNKEHK